ncbi:MAG: sigma-54-dependent Fis family transcriptional regulator [Bacteroidales bacterium]|nr:MAG: sigma-54-dependent Fis family transcriptional regulator [Bacteroidales bacterium]
MKNGSVLIVDDNQGVLNSLELFLKHKLEKVYTAKNPDQVLPLIGSVNIDVILLDMNFSAGVQTGNEGLYWLRRIRKADPDAVVVLLTAYGDLELAVQSIKEGATDFIQKPWDNEKLLSTLQAGVKLKRSRLQVRDLREKQNALKSDIDRQFDTMIGKTAEMQKVFATLRKVSRTNANILIAGENGTGKELVAREIHRQSKRSSEVFVTIDLSTLNENLFESELFGHVKGAFTDAKEERIGKMQSASGGTLFLDEIGNLSVSLQAKLLTVLQNRQIVPVGSNRNIPVDFRLISATNKDLDSLIREGLFREDLLYRIRTIQIDIPPLRDRVDDITALAEYFLGIFTAKYEKNLLRFNSEVIENLKNYHWPGNVREFKHAVERAVILCDSHILKPEDFLLKEPAPKDMDFKESRSMEEYEREIIRHVLKKHKGNITYCADELKIGRQTLYRKIKKYGL